MCSIFEYHLVKYLSLSWIAASKVGNIVGQGRGLWVPTQDGHRNSGQVCVSVNVPLLCDFAWLSTLPLRVLLYLKIWNGHICPATSQLHPKESSPGSCRLLGRQQSTDGIEWV